MNDTIDKYCTIWISMANRLIALSGMSKDKTEAENKAAMSQFRNMNILKNATLDEEEELDRLEQQLKSLGYTDEDVDRRVTKAMVMSGLEWLIRITLDTPAFESDIELPDEILEELRQQEIQSRRIFEEVLRECG